MYSPLPRAFPSSPLIDHKRRLSVMHVIDTDGPGGAETVLLELATRLDPRTFTCIPVVPGIGRWLLDELRGMGLAAEVVPTSWPLVRPFDHTYLRGLRAAIRKLRPDIVHAHSHDSAVYASLALVGSGVSTKMITTFHGSTDVLGPRRFKRLKWGLVRRSSRIVCVSDSLSELARRALSLPASRLVRIHNGIDTDRFAPSRSRALRARFGIADGAMVVGAVGNVRPAKAYEMLIRATAEVHQRDIAIHVLVAGEATGPLADELRALVHKTGLDGAFQFVGYLNDVAEFLNGVDIFALSSRSEGFSLAVAQALAVGLPVVATRCGGPEEIVEDGLSGLLQPVDEPATFATAITALAANPVLRERLGRGARARAVRAFSVGSMVGQYAALYREVSPDQLLARTSE